MSENAKSKMLEKHTLGIMGAILRGSEQICQQLQRMDRNDLEEFKISTDEELADETSILLGEASRMVNSYWGQF